MVEVISIGLSQLAQEQDLLYTIPKLQSYTKAYRG